MKTRFVAFLAIIAFIVSVTNITYAGPLPSKPKFKVAVSIYVGWMPWYYAKESGILKKWADKEGIVIDVDYMSYPGSLDAFVAKTHDACVMTNMEMLNMPAQSGVECEAIIQGDYSNGNDGVCIRDVTSIDGQDVYLVEGTVSHYLLDRCLKLKGKSLKDVKIVNTSDETIEAGFTTTASQKAVVTWNPMLLHIQSLRGVKTIFNSSQIPGEIMDLMVVRSEVLKKNPALGRALVGCWYEVLGIMTQRGPNSDKAMALMAKLSGSDVPEFKAQLTTTYMYYTSQTAYEYMSGKEIQEKMQMVFDFCLKHKLLKDGSVGIQYPDGTIQGDKGNIKMRFNNTFTRLALEGKLGK